LVEIADLLGMAGSTARVQYLRARTKLLDMLKEGMYEK
jgi:DNA-directed RNA polymerase specialized sigma24 family protein